MKFEVLTEDETLNACRDLSIARFGDGELRLATGGDAISQRADPNLARELRDILATYEGFVVGIPNFNATPNKATWDKYRHCRAASGASVFGQDLYGSAFISRPDNAPWIDTADYWGRVRGLWGGKDVALVVGDTKSLTPGMLAGPANVPKAKWGVLGARSVRVVNAPRRDAYTEVDRLEDELSTWSGVVIMCLGATATVLAARLARRGVHALDLGHLGMFMKHAGSYVALDSLISPDYQNQNIQLHADPKGFGGDGKKHADRIRSYASTLGARSVLDYGCGEGTLKASLKADGFPGFIGEYDPAMKGKGLEQLKPAQLLACTDVLEHIEPAHLDNVLAHQYSLAEMGAFFTIATRPANKVLPDGRNAHLIQETPDWWLEKLRGAGWLIDDTFQKMKDGKCREVWVWTRKPGSAKA